MSTLKKFYSQSFFSVNAEWHYYCLAAHIHHEVTRVKFSCLTCKGTNTTKAESCGKPWTWFLWNRLHPSPTTAWSLKSSYNTVPVLTWWEWPRPPWFERNAPGFHVDGGAGQGRGWVTSPSLHSKEGEKCLVQAEWLLSTQEAHHRKDHHQECLNISSSSQPW